MSTAFRLTIAKKVYGLIGVMFLFVIAVSSTLIWTSRDTSAEYSDMLTHDTVGLVELMRVRGDIQNFGRQMNNVLLLTSPPAGIDALEKSLTDLDAAMNRSVKIVNDLEKASTKDLVADLRTGLPQIKKAAASTIAIKRAALGDQDEKARAMWASPTGRPLVVKMYDDIAKTADSELQRLKDASASYSIRTDNVTFISIFVISAGLLASALLAFVVATMGVARPLARLGSTMRRLADHDLAVEVPDTTRADEVGAMARTVQVFKDSALRTAALEREQAEARDRRVAEDERVKEAAAKTASEEAAALVVGSIGMGLERLASGDLTYRLQTPLPPAYEKLRTDLNSAMEQLHGSLGSIVNNTAGIRTGTGEIAQAADDLSKRTEQQAASLEETAAALDEITATVRKTAEGANAAQGVVATAKADAQHSEEVVREAVTAMNAIEQSSREIGQIIGVIDEIAFQTNLLALNAGVEAARAGDAGRGFAVVASEVRALAQRSAQAAKEIKVLIGTSTSQVARGVTLVRDTGTALGRILAQVVQINGVVGEIAASAHEQASGLAQVNTAINQMDQVTQQNAAMVEESTAASHSLAQDTAELEKLTARFIIGTERSSPQSATREAPEPRRANRASSAKSIRVVAGNAVRKPAREEEVWTEF